MFWSKIWFFLVALVGAVALTIALVLPRPAQRATVEEDATRLHVACGVVDVLLADNARNRVELVGTFAREADVETALGDASATEQARRQPHEERARRRRRHDEVDPRRAASPRSRS